MKRKELHAAVKRLASLALALVFVAAFAPFFGAARAEGDVAEPTQAFIVNADGTESEISAEELEALRSNSVPVVPRDIEVVVADDIVDAGDLSLAAEENVIDITPEDAGAPVAEANESVLEGGNTLLLGRPSFDDAEGAYTNATIVQNVTVSTSGKKVIVKGTINAPHYFYGLYVDKTLVSAVTGSTVNVTINMSDFATGYHTVWLAVVEGAGSTTAIDMIYKKYVAFNTLSERPTYNGVFEVYSTYFTYAPYDMAMHNMADKLYLQYSSDGGKTWKTSGYMQANMIQLYISQKYEISGLQPKTTYKTRIRYGKVVTYTSDQLGDGESYFFGGPVLNTTTIKTGSATKPAIKSVRCKAVHVRYHKVRHYGQYTGVYLYTERFYTCKIKVIVRLKKKPGTKGLWIGTKWAKGNKKTYSKTFAIYPNYFAQRPRGHYKYTVTIRSGQSKKWGGYSPSVTKTKKLS